ncbi:hypothetical protein ACEQ8H_000370 [Pleosporales sp. CAS-2024a]
MPPGAGWTFAQNAWEKARTKEYNLALRCSLLQHEVQDLLADGARARAELDFYTGVRRTPEQLELVHDWPGTIEALCEKVNDLGGKIDSKFAFLVKNVELLRDSEAVRVGLDKALRKELEKKRRAGKKLSMEEEALERKLGHPIASFTIKSEGSYGDLFRLQREFDRTQDIKDLIERSSMFINE